MAVMLMFIAIPKRSARSIDHSVCKDKRTFLCFSAGWLLVGVEVLVSRSFSRYLDG